MFGEPLNSYANIIGKSYNNNAKNSAKEAITPLALLVYKLFAIYLTSSLSILPLLSPIFYHHHLQDLSSYLARNT